MSPTQPSSPNFGFLQEHDPLLVALGAQAERYFAEDPATALVKLRQFGEVLARRAAANVGLYASPEESQIDLLHRLRDAGVLTPEVRSIFHEVRRVGNAATHEVRGTHSDALASLKLARQLGIWFHRAFGAPKTFNPGPFIPPPDPAQESRAIAGELERLRKELAETKLSAEAARAAVEEEARRRLSVEERAKRDSEERGVWQALAEEAEHRLNAALAAVQVQSVAKAPEQLKGIAQQAHDAGVQLDLNEDETRRLIDGQLQLAGWEADSVALAYQQGVRPTKGRNLAIAEWPTANGPADYVLFAGLTPLAVVEAKRKRKDVAGAIEQSKRYSRDYLVRAHEQLPEGPWGDYKIPFLFATNGRPFLRTIKTKCGIWFLDARRSTNHSRPLEGWYTPEGLSDLLTQNTETADASLSTEPSGYLPLWDFQYAAIRAVEEGIAAGRQNMLLAMATGTGKTRTALCLVYRLLKAKRFRRVLFLVDRRALATQAQDAFKDVRLENQQSLTEIYDVKSLGDLKPERDTRLHVATIQGMVKRILFPTDGQDPVPVDWYDCIIVDECHRGYNLDKEMSDSEIQYRSERDYISMYTRVLDHFDAVRIGLTATPALETTRLFGAPIYEYGYRQAVIDGKLIDHEPPYVIKTRLNQEGIHWQANDQVPVYNTASDQLTLFQTPDDVDIEVEGFNTQVITENFNQVVCDYLARAIDPSLPGKTMIFCATDSHADMVVDLLKKSFAAEYGTVEDDAVLKITGAADDSEGKLRRYKNERLPNVAVTVDLLTTGIDVPKITNLVFIRRVKSRILYEQMMGRATRLCAEIGKEFFRIYDAVDLYSALAPYTSMKPVVTRPIISFAQLTQELLSVADVQHQKSVIDELTAKLQQRKRRLKGESLASFVTLAGMEPASLLTLLKSDDVPAISSFFKAHEGLAEFLDKFKPRIGRNIYVSDHEDELVEVERGYGKATKPEEYLAGFRDFIEKNKNAIDALLVVTQRPRDLTRQQLRELELKLAAEGYSARNLQTAWQQISNHDIAASIIGFIRQQALGSPLLSYQERVDRAVHRILSSRPWEDRQRQWLERIGKQLHKEKIVGAIDLDRGQFKAEGGFHRLDKIFGGKLEQVLGELHEELWRDSA